MSEVAKGFRQWRFFDLSDRDKRDMLKLMARVAEQAYRRGVQQGAGLAGKPSFREEWRIPPLLSRLPASTPGRQMMRAIVAQVAALTEAAQVAQGVLAQHQPLAA